MRTAFFYSLLLSCTIWACQSGTSEKHSTQEESIPPLNEIESLAKDSILPENPGEETTENPDPQDIKPYSPAQSEDVVVLPSAAKNKKTSATEPSPQTRPTQDVPADDAIENNSGAQGISDGQPTKGSPPSHAQWNTLLQKYVDSKGNVNYSGLGSEQAALGSYLETLAAHPVQSDWPRKEKLAYWINAYNAFTLKLILDNYPTSSITNLHGGKPWDLKWIKLGDKTYSLNNIENDIIRPQFKEPRIHFAVNCAAKSCPPLLNQAWTADNLDRHLEKQTRQFINDSHFNQIQADRASVSKIFEWYAADFGDLTAFLNRYSNTALQEAATIAYLEYDWALNRK